MRGKIIATGIALLALAVGWSNIGARAEPLKIRGAWVAPLANLSSVWLQKKDLAVHFGQSYVFEPVHYAGTPPMITAIANERARDRKSRYSTLPIASRTPAWMISGSSPTTSRMASGLRILKITGAEGRPDQKVEDLKGRVLATNAAGSAVDVAMRRCCASTASNPIAIIRGRSAVTGHESHARGKESRSHPFGAAVLLRPGTAQSDAHSFVTKRGNRRSQFVLWSAPNR